MLDLIEIYETKSQAFYRMGKRMKIYKTQNISVSVLGHQTAQKAGSHDLGWFTYNNMIIIINQPLSRWVDRSSDELIRPYDGKPLYMLLSLFILNLPVFKYYMYVSKLLIHRFLKGRSCLIPVFLCVCQAIYSAILNRLLCFFNIWWNISTLRVIN